MLLSEAQTKVLKLLDDESGVRFDAANDKAEVNIALKSAQGEAWTEAVSAGANLFMQEAAFTSSTAGAVDLTSVIPRRIVNVTQVSGTTRLAVLPVRLDDVLATLASAVTLRVAYIPGVTFPALVSDPFVWGSSSVAADVQAPLSNLMCAIAAGDLAPKDAAVNAMLERRKEELRASIRKLMSVPGWSVIPLGGATGRTKRASFDYCAGTAPHTLQLVVR
jgi:hypothetical protein